MSTALIVIDGEEGYWVATLALGSRSDS